MRLGRGAAQTPLPGPCYHVPFATAYVFARDFKCQERLAAVGGLILRSFKNSLILATVAVGIVAVAFPTGSASHIAIAALIGAPAGSGTNTVDFTYEELNTLNCCAGVLNLDFGNGMCGDTGWTSINQYTPAGTYSGELYPCGSWWPTGSFAWTIDHPTGTGLVPNSRITFSYTYGAAGQYEVKWNNCCASNPISGYPFGDYIWSSVISASSGTPVGNAGGTVTVVAL